MPFSTAFASFLALLLLTLPRPALAKVTFTSGTAQIPLLELYTSEGCSSCPPAEKWLQSLSSSPELWKTLVPINFHVDYWDNLGWKDPFAQASFTQRQYNYSGSWGTNSVYTPGFVWNGAEWRGWFQKQPLPEMTPLEVGNLEVQVSDLGEIEVSFIPSQTWSGGKVHAALLGFEIISNVKRGENSGQHLSHSFVVLDHSSGTLQLSPTSPKVWTSHLAALNGEAPRRAIAVWIESAGQQKSVQSVGGWLPRKT